MIRVPSGAPAGASRTQDRRGGFDIGKASRGIGSLHSELEPALGPGIECQARNRALASLPSLDQIRAQIIGLLQAPATKVAGVLQAPAGQLARVFNAYATKDAA